MVNAVVEVKAPRDITRQMLRHRSFSFQEFSQRYSDEIQFCDREVRMQDKTNRQNSISIEDFYNGPNQYVRDTWDEDVKEIVELVKEHYKDQQGWCS